jgi:hypothetical protein
MTARKRSYLAWGIAVAARTLVVMASGPELRKQTLAPHEVNVGDAPPPIIRDTPALPKGGVNFESAEEPVGANSIFW